MVCDSDVAVVNDGHDGCSNADNGETGDDTALVKQLEPSAASCAERPLELQNADLQRYTILLGFSMIRIFCYTLHSGWWRSTVGRTSVSDWRTFPVLRSTCS